jgi:hypothetical protein
MARKNVKESQAGDEWVQIGVVGVDTGQLMLCDPSYVDGEWVNEEFVPGLSGAKEAFSYNAACQKTLAQPFNDGQLNFKRGHAGVAVVTTTGLGDGLYPVYARFEKSEWGRRVVELRVSFEEDGVKMNTGKKVIM